MLRAAGFFLLLGLPAVAEPPGQEAHAEAERLLAAGEAESAVQSAFEAIQESRRFLPEDWGIETPEGRIVLDEFRAAARARYRTGRARYRATLGRALGAAGNFRGARAELRRSVALDPQPDAYRAIAELPGLPLAERVDALLLGWSAGGRRDGSLREALAATGGFPHADAMVAAVERFRLKSPEADRLRIPPQVVTGDVPFPELSLAVRGGVYASTRSFREGRILILALADDGCGRCSDLVEDLQTTLRGRGVDAIVAVGDEDLPLLTRIAELAGAGFFQPEPQAASARARIGGRPIAHVVRRANLPEALREAAPGTLWVVARSGFLTLRAEQGEAPVRRILEPLLRFLDDPPFPGGTEPLSSPDEETLTETIRAFEALGHPTGAFEEQLATAVRDALRIARDPAERALELLDETSVIRGGNLARLRLLDALIPRIGDRLLEAARERDPAILRARRDGTLLVAVAEGRVGIQRQYEREDESVVLLHGLLDGDGSVRALGVAAGEARGVTAHESGFRFAHAECVSWGGETLATRCPASLRDGAVVVETRQLVGSPVAGPVLWRRVDGGPENETVETLLAGLEAFASGSFEEAAELFANAEPEPGSPVDDAAIRYNLATTRALLGEREEALAMLEAIGDATFAPLVQSAARALYGSTRSPRGPGPIR